MKTWLQAISGSRTGLPDSHTPLLGPAVRYRIPELTGISLTDISKPRENEESFAEVRDALVQLDRACIDASGRLGGPDEYLAYKDFVAEYADEIVRPSYDSLNRRLGRMKLIERAGHAGVGLLTAGLEPVIGFTPVVGDMIGDKIADRLTHHAREVRAQNEIGCKILKTVLRHANTDANQEF